MVGSSTDEIVGKVSVDYKMNLRHVRAHIEASSYSGAVCRCSLTSYTSIVHTYSTHTYIHTYIQYIQYKYHNSYVLLVITLTTPTSIVHTYSTYIHAYIQYIISINSTIPT